MMQRLEGRDVPATFTVLNDGNAGAGSLRQAILDANNFSGPDDIAFDASFFNTPRTITLLATSGQLVISGDLIVNGPGPPLLTVNGGGAVRPFNVESPTAVINVILRGMTVTGGNGTSNGTTAGDGGGIRTTNENLTLDTVVVTGNSATGINGGGVTATSAAFLTVRNSTISGNTARRGGGIYFVSGGGLLLENSTVSGNVATDITPGDGGGGIRFVGAVAAGGFTVRNSTVAGNTSGGSGGGLLLRAFSGTAAVRNSTITGNTANTTSTTAGYGGGGIALATGSAASVLAIESSIVSGNAATAANGRSDIAAVAATTVNLNFSAAGDADGFAFTGGINLPFGTALSLLPLGNYGGPTQTVALGVGSAAADAGSNPAALATDQRGPGFPRQVGPAVDIGAFEGILDAPAAAAGPCPT